MNHATNALAFAIVASTALAQHKAVTAKPKVEKFNPFVVDKQPPAVCDSYLMGIVNVQGTEPYRRLLYISTALESAESGAKEATESMKKLNETTNLTAMWAEALSGETAWEDHMRCSAQIMFRLAPPGREDNDSITATLLTVAFNQEAHARQMLAVSQKGRFTRGHESSPTEQLADAEELHKIELEQKDAADSILKAGLLSAALAKDMSGDPNGKIQRLAITCSELHTLSGMLDPVAKDDSNVFGQTAKSMSSMLSELPCQ